MPVQLRIALGQFNAVLGDIEANLNAMRKMCAEAVAEGADLVIFPEMAVSGYPPEDLLHKKHFIWDCQKAVSNFLPISRDIAVIAGFPEISGQGCYNAAAVIRDGRIENIYHKALLPNYGVFDEQRYFRPGKSPLCFQINGIRTAVTICEDIWDLGWLDGQLEAGQVDLIVNLSASPFHAGKMADRIEILGRCAKKFDAAIAYCNLAGAQDELVFDGRSVIVNPDGKIAACAEEFEEDMIAADIIRDDDGRITAANVFSKIEDTSMESIDPVEEVYHALVLGTRDYVKKNNFQKVLIGLSGGIDSSLVAAVAVDALGKDKVCGVTMPSKFNSPETIEDARILAENLGIEFLTVPIADILGAFDNTLSLVDGWDDKGLAFENLQARIRGSILMSISNQSGFLVLTTGNKSETAVGYSTLYGDTAGGFAIIKDVPKTLVYKLCRFVNLTYGVEVIPESVITRPPSAELRPDQKDTDSLPDYDLLDEVLTCYIERDLSGAQIVEMGFDAAVVDRIVKMVDRNEYKRRQSPPGIKITPKAFGRDRRMPITNRYAAKVQRNEDK